ncbi:1-acyl-sn-glycerol-3-phosphate acyltransferase [uncultured Draconibacterium sp.]|uniref:1-acyl-sn-glycerol-3-phosphate acyltransferase n=1 Tax=uncultured Draconibacterium sp. TaxID=1573823 RepID=UPI0025E037E7|nr:1-acyl-sn-glycerol-3-phosphate acyltransferase [uncultured Draconibacterium sp.]
MKGISIFLLKLMGWKTVGEKAPDNKCIIIGAPHTSAWDFVISWLFYTSKGAVANVLIKKEFFFWPLGYFIKKMGGLPIDRSKGANVIRQTINLINTNEYVHLALTPEGTRSLNKRWKAGFHIIAKETGIPVYLGYFDWGRKEISIGEKFELSDDARQDIRRMKDFYREKGIKGKFPELFSTEY